MKVKLDRMRSWKCIEALCPNLFAKYVGRLPRIFQATAAEWVFFGRESGGDFFRSILANDFADAVCRADETNIQQLIVFAIWLNNDIPSEAWKAKNLTRWEDRRGLFGIWYDRGLEHCSEPATAPIHSPMAEAS